MVLGKTLVSRWISASPRARAVARFGIVPWSRWRLAALGRGRPRSKGRGHPRPRASRRWGAVGVPWGPRSAAPGWRRGSRWIRRSHAAERRRAQRGYALPPLLGTPKPRAGEQPGDVVPVVLRPKHSQHSFNLLRRQSPLSTGHQACPLAVAAAPRRDRPPPWRRASCRVRAPSRSRRSCGCPCGRGTPRPVRCRRSLPAAPA